VLAEYRLDADLRARIAMVTRMMQAGFLRPAVVVLAGPKSNVARMESAWKAYLVYVLHTLSNAMMPSRAVYQQHLYWHMYQQRLEAKTTAVLKHAQRCSYVLKDRVHETSIRAFDDSDKEAIFGDPSDAIMRGLFRWIDDITNPVHNRSVLRERLPFMQYDVFIPRQDRNALHSAVEVGVVVLAPGTAFFSNVQYICLRPVALNKGGMASAGAVSTGWSQRRSMNTASSCCGSFWRIPTARRIACSSGRTGLRSLSAWKKEA
jgi:hypothetical protein